MGGIGKKTSVKLKRFGEESDLHLGSLEACAKAKFLLVCSGNLGWMGVQVEWN